MKKTSHRTTQPNDIVVFSHLRWEFVKQRPQHILERMAKTSKVLFVEEPIGFDQDNYRSAKEIHINENILVIQPYINHGDYSSLSRVVDRYIEKHLDNSQPVAWFYSASFLPILEYLQPSLIVYDCMDELSAFKGAPAQLIEDEKKLLSLADVVFTGGKSLFESKSKQNPNTFCFPSSVEKKHFEQAFAKNTPIPEDIAKIPHPIAGFYGVIDERMDLQLLSQIAGKNPDVSFVMIGPVVKIEEKDLPKQKNIYYLGGKSYSDLPQYLKAFDIAMMPFALNESTRFISPTKTLEFMAAHKPIVSTPIYDVKRDYSKEVYIAHSASEFSRAIQKYIHETPQQKKHRVEFQKAVIERTSWDKTAQLMQKIIQTAEGNRTDTHEVSVLPTRSIQMSLQLIS